MSKTIELVRQEVETIKNEVEDFANSASRIGEAMSDILEYNKELTETEANRAKDVEQSLSEEINNIKEAISNIGGEGEGSKEVTRAEFELVKIESKSTFEAFSELGMTEGAKTDGYEIALAKATNTAEKTKVKVPVFDAQNMAKNPVGLVDEIFVEDMANMMDDKIEDALNDFTPEEGGGSTEVIDDLTSTSTTAALSANQGKVLDEKINRLADDVGSNSDDTIINADNITTLARDLGVCDSPAWPIFDSESSYKAGDIVRNSKSLLFKLIVDYDGDSSTVDEDTGVPVSAERWSVKAGLEDINNNIDTIDNRVSGIEIGAENTGQKADMLIDYSGFEQYSEFDGAEPYTKGDIVRMLISDGEGNSWERLVRLTADYNGSGTPQYEPWNLVLDTERANTSDNMGYVILRKGISFAEQVTKENTVYEVRYDFDLGGETVTIPIGCVLKFIGGKISNGTIVFSDTTIEGNDMCLISVIVEGTITNDEVYMSWFVDAAKEDNTNEFQSCINMALLKKGCAAVINRSVRVTDINITNKYNSGLRIVGVNRSNQGAVKVTVYGEGSQGLDISGDERIVLENLYIYGDEDKQPVCLLYASRTSENKQVVGTRLLNVAFDGYATKALVYNYAGEMWKWDRCTIRIPESYTGEYGIYASSVNTEEVKSKFATTKGYGDTYDDNGTERMYPSPLTDTTFRDCSFGNSSEAKTIYIEGGFKQSSDAKGTDITAGGIYFDKCYWHSPHASSATFKDVTFGISLINCDDESGATYTTYEGNPLFSILTSEATEDEKTPTNNTLNGLMIIGCNFFSKSQGEIINVKQRATKVFIAGNHSYNATKWKFRELDDAVVYNLAKWESFVATMVYNNSVTVTPDNGRITLTDRFESVLKQKNSLDIVSSSPIGKLVPSAGSLVRDNSRLWIGAGKDAYGWIEVMPKVETLLTNLSKGNYEVNQIVTTVNYSYGYGMGIIAVAGTVADDITCTANTTADSNVITITSASNPLKVGQYINVGDIKTKITGVSSMTVTCADNITSTSENVSISYAAPRLHPFGSVYIEAVDPNYIGVGVKMNGSKVLFTRDKMEAIVYDGAFYYHDGYPVARRRGSTAGRHKEYDDNHRGAPYFDTEVKRQVFWNGTRWITGDGFTDARRSGTTDDRPNMFDTDAGFQYFDTTLGKAVWWNGTVWVDSSGETV